MEPRAYAQEAHVVDRDGVMIGTLLSIDESSDPASLVLMLARDGRHVRIPVEQVVVAESTADRIVVDVPGDALLASTAPAATAGAERATGTAEPPAGEIEAEHLTIPLAAEELVARTHEVEKGRVLITKSVETVPVERAVDVEHDEVEVQRIPVGAMIDAVPEVRHEGDTMVVPVVEEVLVVEKRLRLVEELHVTRRRVREQQTVRGEVRREVADVTAEDAAPRE